jgi:hypothetical protein
VAREDPRILPLAFHVDYWNSLGWTDPFSSELATNRQREYAASFNTTSVYTPEMIVGGVDAFVGSDRGRASAAIARSIAAASSTHVTLSARAGEGQTVNVRFSIQPIPTGATLYLALVERGLRSRVVAGENSGKLLLHENVVRAFVGVPIRGPDGVGTLVVPDEVDRSRARIIGYVQATGAPGHGMPILAATATSAPRAGAR